MNIYIVGFCGYEAAKILYQENKEKLKNHFPAFFLAEFEKLNEEKAVSRNYLEHLCIEKNTKSPYSYKKSFSDPGIFVREIRDGGLFGALWAVCEDRKEAEKEMGRERAAGCRVMLDEIPMEQHVVEILEFFRENPYEVSSPGSFLILCDEAVLTDGEGALPAGVKKIGCVTDSSERVIVSKDHKRFLTPPERQEKDITARRNGSVKESCTLRNTVR